jgi:mRNA-degrading endonuclease toxin of MazEF toxin-antitoxin module
MRDRVAIIAEAAIGLVAIVPAATARAAIVVHVQVGIGENVVKADVRISAEAVGVLSMARSISSSKSSSRIASIWIIRRTWL